MKLADDINYQHNDHSYTNPLMTLQTSFGKEWLTRNARTAEIIKKEKEKEYAAAAAEEVWHTRARANIQEKMAENPYARFCHN